MLRMLVWPCLMATAVGMAACDSESDDGPAPAAPVDPAEVQEAAPSKVSGSVAPSLPEVAEDPSEDGSLGDETFQTVVPEGYQRGGSPRLMMLSRTEPSPTSESFLSSIVILPVRHANGADQVETTVLEGCRAAAESSAASLLERYGLESEHLGQETLELPSGPACQYELGLPDAPQPRTILGTVLRSDEGHYKVICSLAIGDTIGRGGCDALLRRWTWSAGG